MEFAIKTGKTAVMDATFRVGIICIFLCIAHNYILVLFCEFLSVLYDQYIYGRLDLEAGIVCHDAR